MEQRSESSLSLLQLDLRADTLGCLGNEISEGDKIEIILDDLPDTESEAFKVLPQQIRTNRIRRPSDYTFDDCVTIIDESIKGDPQRYMPSPEPAALVAGEWRTSAVVRVATLGRTWFTEAWWSLVQAMQEGRALCYRLPRAVGLLQM